MHKSIRRQLRRLRKEQTREQQTVWKHTAREKGTKIGRSGDKGGRMHRGDSAADGTRNLENFKVNQPNLENFKVNSALTLKFSRLARS